MKKKKGYLKITNACQFVQQLVDLQYIWIDTVCIDKSSSAELSEAINSMFRWYQNSNICLVYLADVDSFDPRTSITPSNLGHGTPQWPPMPENVRQQFLHSRWFTRGWTLQELLAPTELLYLSKDWELLGDHRSLIPHISTASKIPEKYLKSKAWK